MTEDNNQDKLGENSDHSDGGAQHVASADADDEAAEFDPEEILGEIPEFEIELAGGEAESPGAGAASDSERAKGPALAELIATRAELKRVVTERGDLADRLARRQADFENYRKRVERERAEMHNRVVGEVVRALLPVTDNLRRALDAEASMQAGESEEFRHFLNGVELIWKQINDVLANFGVEAVPTVGERFDPHIHEAIAMEHSDTVDPDTVVEEMVKGYKLGSKLLRPAKVKVSTR